MLGGKKRRKNWKSAFFCLDGGELCAYSDDSHDTLKAEPFLRISLANGAVQWERQLTKKDNAILVSSYLFTPGISSKWADTRDVGRAFKIETSRCCNITEICLLVQLSPRIFYFKVTRMMSCWDGTMQFSRHAKVCVDYLLTNLILESKRTTELLTSHATFTIPQQACLLYPLVLTNCQTGCGTWLLPPKRETTSTQRFFMKLNYILNKKLPLEKTCKTLQLCNL